MSKTMNVTLHGLRRLRALLKSRSKEAKSCPDVCIVLPPNFGFRPGDRFKARYVNGELIVTNTRKLTPKEQRAIGRELNSEIENANWSSRLLPCPMCGSRANLWPEVPEMADPGYRIIEVRCKGCGLRTDPHKCRKAEEAVAAWNWRVQLQENAERAVLNPAEMAKAAKVKKPKARARSKQP